ncbi:MAG: hypothetical protein A3F67_09140 [Verrucomicrobia bacterium RIFCSPHIGHO2_12_FULL_41_10]|nr:MAG: hypothetical protein A3F67_09140 [Verrucomicrobia bacterium RIFCSPHIGHO2_12_FULL_41_10]HLB33041.1 D-hexose-6-phosphate mutarotase [Chthoniobacterales bacterium]
MQKNLQQFEIPGHVVLSNDENGLPKITITTDQSSAEIYIYGAHVTSFQKKGEIPLLFMSESRRVERGKMLHGGIPVCYPWFGAHAGEAFSHGFARHSVWDLMETKAYPSGAVMVRLVLPRKTMVEAGWAAVETELFITVTNKLTLELKVRNTTKEDFLFEECFHSYFSVGDIQKTTVHGLQGLQYLDKTEDLVEKLESSNEIPIVGETNRIYLESTGALEIHDPSLDRTIRIEKMHSHSTVVWNPWKEKATDLPDFGDDDYLHMLCVESGNVAASAVKLAPGESSSMKVILSTFSN